MCDYEHPRVLSSMEAPLHPPPQQSTNNANPPTTPPRGTAPPLHNTGEVQQAVHQHLQVHQAQAASHPIFPEDGKPLEPPPPYSMCSASSNTQYTPSVNANSPPSYSQSFADYFEFDI